MSRRRSAIINGQSRKTHKNTGKSVKCVMKREMKRATAGHRRRTQQVTGRSVRDAVIRKTDKEAHTGNPCSECNYSSSSGGSDKDDTDKPGGPDKDDTDKPSDYKLVTKIHVSGTDKASVITCARSFDKFVDILVDGAEVPKQLYTARSGSTIVEISADYLTL